jgi:uncharacterized membrane protein YidH (DUF202 family)
VDDPGLAFERTTLAWNRTGLSSVAAGAVCLKVFWGGAVLGVLLATLLLLVGGLAYAAGVRAPASASTLRALSLAVTSSAAMAVLLTIVG